jgi:hypothetical protein
MTQNIRNGTGGYDRCCNIMRHGILSVGYITFVTEKRYIELWIEELEDKIKNKIRENLQINILKVILINNRIRLYGHILRVNKERNPKKILSLKLRGKCPRGRMSSRWRP